MNRSFLIIMVPALLVAAGYIVVLRYMGIAPGYPRLVVAMILFFGMIYRLSRRAGAGRIPSRSRWPRAETGRGGKSGGKPPHSK